jgi:hypothetical protein
MYGRHVIGVGILIGLLVCLTLTAQAGEKSAAAVPKPVFVVNTGDASVSLADLTSMKEINRYPVGPRPYGIAVMFVIAPPKENSSPQEVTYHGVQAVHGNLVLAASPVAYKNVAPFVPVSLRCKRCNCRSSSCMSRATREID